MTDHIANDMVYIEGYSIHRLDMGKQVNKARGGGLLLYYKDELKVIKVDAGTKCCKD